MRFSLFSIEVKKVPPFGSGPTPKVRGFPLAGDPPHSSVSVVLGVVSLVSFSHFLTDALQDLCSLLPDLRKILPCFETDAALQLVLSPPGSKTYHFGI